MKQRKTGEYLCYRQSATHVLYVSAIPSDGGTDWEYSTDSRKAKLLDEESMRRFKADVGQHACVAAILK